MEKTPRRNRHPIFTSSETYICHEVMRMYVDGPSFNPFKTQSQVSLSFYTPDSGRNYFTALIY